MALKRASLSSSSEFLALVTSLVIKFAYIGGLVSKTLETLGTLNLLALRFEISHSGCVLLKNCAIELLLHLVSSLTPRDSLFTS